MNCRSCRETLTALIDKELSADEQTSVETHLSTCRECSKEYDALFFAFNLTEQVDSISLNPSVWGHVEAGVASIPKRLNLRESFSQMFLARHWRPVAAAVGTVGAGFVLFFSLSDSGTDRVLDEEFTEFIRAREGISQRNRRVLFDALEKDHRGVNPFVIPISQEQGNPFQE